MGPFVSGTFNWFGSRYIKEEFNMAFVPSLAQGALLMFITTLACITSGSGSIFPTPMVLPPPTASPKTCPLYSTKGGFHLEKFLGDWYVLEYVYNKPMRMKDLSCVGFHFSLTSFGELQSNFTFRFPAKTGHFYHVPTFSIVNPANSAVWDTQFKGVELASLILGTDYGRWAVLAQCNKNPADGSTRYLSTRILSRTRSLSPEALSEVARVINSADSDAPFRYPVDQSVCQEIDG